MKSWHESPAALIVQPPRRSVRPTGAPPATAAGAPGVAVAVCAFGSSAARPVGAARRRAASSPERAAPGGGSVAPVTEPAGTAASGSGACSRGSSRPKDIMLQPAASTAVTATVMSV